MKFQQLKEEMEQTIEDKNERSKVLEGSLGDILSSTQVIDQYVFKQTNAIIRFLTVFRWSC